MKLSKISTKYEVRSAGYEGRGTRYGILMLIVAVLLGAGLRLYKLGVVPTSLYWDETAIGYDAYALKTWGKDMHGNPGLQAIFPSYGDYKLPMYIWLTTISEYFLGPTPFAVRLPSALAGLGIIVIVYFVALELFKKPIMAGFAALVTGILPMDILFSRTGFEGHVAAFFIGITLFIWLRSRRKPWLMLFSSVTGAAAVYSYFSARIVIPLMALATFVVFFRQTHLRWKVLSLISFGVWILLLLPIYFSPFYAASNQFRMSTANLSDTGTFAVQSNVYREQSGNSFITRVVYHRYLLQAKAILSHIVAHLDFRYLFISGDQNLRHSTGTVGVLFLGMLPLFCLGVFHLFHNFPRVLWWSAGIWIAAVIPAAIPMEVPHALRSLNTLFVFCIIGGAGLAYLWEQQQRWLLGLIGGFIVIELLLFGHDYFIHYPSRSASAWQSGYFELAQYLHLHENQFVDCTVEAADDRLYLYFLFTNRINPQTLTKTDNSYAFSTIGQYRFAAVEATPSPSHWVAVHPSTWDRLGQPAATVITNSAQTPVFYVIPGKE